MFTKTDLQAAEQLRRTLQMFAGTLPETQALEVATVYPQYQTGHDYHTGEYLTSAQTKTATPCCTRWSRTTPARRTGPQPILRPCTPVSV